MRSNAGRWDIIVVLACATAGFTVHCRLAEVEGSKSSDI